MTKAPPAALAVVSATAELLEQALEEIRSLDPIEHRRTQRDLESGGRLRLVVDRDADGAVVLVRTRVRLLSSIGRNRWIWSRTVPAKPRS